MSQEPYRQLHHSLLLWYQNYGRVTLPWRNTQNPYKVYLSEIMLQQTQVKTVVERFYFPFLERFPTLKDIANASEESILKAWEGLGYYARARNLHKTAQLCNGFLPNNAEALEKLPGIGKSTAHAIACFAFNAPLPVLDANVKRILYRFFAIKYAKEKELWEKAYRLFDYKNSYIYNQTLMDIGATLCLHKNPNCLECPLSSACQGKKDPLQYPRKKTIKTKPIKKRDIILYQQKNRYSLKQNTTRLLQRLWSFPQKDKNDNHNSFEHLTHLGDITHHYSHFTIKASIFLTKTQPDDETEWFEIQQIKKLPISGVDKKVLNILDAYLA